MLRQAEWLGSGEAPAAERHRRGGAIAEDVAGAGAHAPRPRRALPSLAAPRSRLRRRWRRARETTSSSTRRPALAGAGPRQEPPDQLRVNLLVGREGGPSTWTRWSCTRRGSERRTSSGGEELGLEERVIKKDLGRVLLELEEQQEAERGGGQHEEAVTDERADERRRSSFCVDPHLLERILDDFDACGVVGERTNKLVGYLAATSRKLERAAGGRDPESAAAGKSSLMDAVLS